MKILRQFVLPFSVLTVAAVLLCSAAPNSSSTSSASAASYDQTKSTKIAVVNFKTCVEKSKLGQKEQSNFDAMKKQMETVLMEKEKSLTDIASKFNDIDYLDSLSPEAEKKLKDEFRTKNQEFNQQQNQFYQALSQTNVKIIQKLTEAITKVSEEVAKKNQIDIVLNEDSSFYISSKLDISQQVIAALDEAFEKDNKDAKAASPTP